MHSCFTPSFCESQLADGTMRAHPPSQVSRKRRPGWEAMFPSKRFPNLSPPPRKKRGRVFLTGCIFFSPTEIPHVLTGPLPVLLTSLSYTRRVQAFIVDSPPRPQVLTGQWAIRASSQCPGLTPPVQSPETLAEWGRGAPLALSQGLAGHAAMIPGEMPFSSPKWPLRGFCGPCPHTAPPWRSGHSAWPQWGSARSP